MDWWLSPFSFAIFEGVGALVQPLSPMMARMQLQSRTQPNVEAGSATVGGKSALLGLPDELLELIALRLPAASLYALGACCGRLRGITSSDLIWQPLYISDFPRGRTSLDGLACWRDAYRRAAQMVPSPANPDAMGIFEFRDPPAPKSSKPVLDRTNRVSVAFDGVHQRVVAVTHPSHKAPRAQAAGMDGREIPMDQFHTLRAGGCKFLLVDRQTNQYIGVGIASYSRESLVGLLDENFVEIQPFTVIRTAQAFHLQRVAVRPNGGLFLLGTSGELYSTDPLSRNTGRLLNTNTIGPAPMRVADFVADERDCAVIAHNHSIITFDSDGRHLSTLSVNGAEQLAISRDGVMAVLRRTYPNAVDVIYEVLFFASNTVEAPPLFCYQMPPRFGRLSLRILWTDERLLAVVTKRFATP
eukprot:TRINITY_DN3268_c0_g2_i1.p1 TRINITY_DN3268_c0_g2~~TRINITY_DN3268_c0_g2_i1.p1  ORF type:complete len:414 (-),score=44.42 TRINITY_DN3268_c0_g2_i1:210-1451(-)